MAEVRQKVDISLRLDVSSLDRRVTALISNYTLLVGVQILVRTSLRKTHF
jgi:hypothetical protein